MPRGSCCCSGCATARGWTPSALRIETLQLTGLDDESARALLAAGGDGLAPQLTDELVAAAGGNPLALRESRAG